MEITRSFTNHPSTDTLEPVEDKKLSAQELLVGVKQDYDAIESIAKQNPGKRYKIVITPQGTDDMPDNASFVHADFSGIGCPNSTLLHYLYRSNGRVGIEVSFSYDDTTKNGITMMVVCFMAPGHRSHPTRS
jgi:hypothetical protein